MTENVEHHVIALLNILQMEQINVGQLQMLTLKLIFGQQVLDVSQQPMIIVSVMHLKVGKLIQMEFLLIVIQLPILLENKELSVMEMRMNVGERQLELLQMSISQQLKQLPLLMKLQNHQIQDLSQDVFSHFLILEVVKEFVTLQMGTTNHGKMEKLDQILGLTQKTLIVLKLPISMINKLKELYMMNVGLLMFGMPLPRQHHIELLMIFGQKDQDARSTQQQDFLTVMKHLVL